MGEEPKRGILLYPCNIPKPPIDLPVAPVHSGTVYNIPPASDGEDEVESDRETPPVPEVVHPKLHRVQTAHLAQRQHPHGRKRALPGEPWHPVTNPQYWDGQPQEPAPTRVTLPTNRMQLPSVVRINPRKVTKILTRIFNNPGYACLTCILFDRLCEFRGYGAYCTACELQNKNPCSFKFTDRQLEHFRLLAMPWFHTGYGHIWRLVEEMHSAFVRAQRAQVEAVRATQEFRDKWLEFHSCANNTIRTVGVFNFKDRFTPDNATEDLIEVINNQVDIYNIILARQRFLHSRRHLEAFDIRPSGEQNVASDAAPLPDLAPHPPGLSEHAASTIKRYTMPEGPEAAQIVEEFDQAAGIWQNRDE
ncbi:hypothetical protein DFH07DRAFT_974975, partial [Mycena maculata]